MLDREAMLKYQREQEQANREWKEKESALANKRNWQNMLVAAIVGAVGAIAIIVGAILTAKLSTLTAAPPSKTQDTTPIHK